MDRILDYQKYASLVRQCAAEGCVLLKNKNHALPVRETEIAAVFGRMQLDSYYCGTGSGGMVNPPYVVSILDGLKTQRQVYQPLAERYREWTASHPFDKGNGWAQEPWSQPEIPLEDEIIRDAAMHADLAIAVIGRTAGEDKDNTPQPGGFLLTAEELSLLRRIRREFTRMAVVLNTGSVIDMSWEDEIRPESILYVWQGGCETGNAVADVLSGNVPACGKLTDTIAAHLSDYPSSENFGNEDVNIYAEDIYVGYRYFETFTPDCVRYPFGFGLTYSSFSWSASTERTDEEGVRLLATVRNEGAQAGKEVLQFYVCPPQGKLGKPIRSLAGFHKTRFLKPGEEETFSIFISADSMASYDDSGISGFPHAWILEPGRYAILAGFDVRSAKETAAWELQKLRTVEQLTQAAAPVQPFRRLRPTPAGGVNQYQPAWEEVPLRQKRAEEKTENIQPVQQEPTGSISWEQVRNGSRSVSEFLAQLSDEELICMTRGEGMCSPKVTPGTAGALGAVTESLKAYGMPIACCADGPSGIRMDCGTMAFSIPSGTSLACTFNSRLVQEMFEMVGLELIKNRVDTILGPGINIHRHPLCGRNFEYYSEDPYLSGVMAAAALNGMHTYGVTGTVKHFACNNQEHRRSRINAVISERALREIYLKPFEMAVKQGHARSIMTSYNPINGIWSASNPDLLTTVLREQWGFSGMVMTDWWAEMNEEGTQPSRQNTAAMIRAQNDVYMVTADALHNSGNDNSAEALAEGRLTRGELLRSAENICAFLLASPASEPVHPALQLKVMNAPRRTSSAIPLRTCDIQQAVTVLDLEGASTTKGTTLCMELRFSDDAKHQLRWHMRCEAEELSQLPVTFYWNGDLIHTLTMHGHEDLTGTIPLNASSRQKFRLELFFGESGIILESLQVERAE